MMKTLCGVALLALGLLLTACSQADSSGGYSEQAMFNHAQDYSGSYVDRDEALPNQYDQPSPGDLGSDR